MRFAFPFDQHLFGEAFGHLRPVFHHDDTLRDADLWRRETDTRRVPHRHHHSGDEILHLRSADGVRVDHCGWRPQNGVTDLNDHWRFDVHFPTRPRTPRPAIPSWYRRRW